MSMVSMVFGLFHYQKKRKLCTLKIDIFQFILGLTDFFLISAKLVDPIPNN